MGIVSIHLTSLLFIACVCVICVCILVLVCFWCCLIACVLLLLLVYFVCFFLSVKNKEISRCVYRVCTYFHFYQSAI